MNKLQNSFLKYFWNQKDSDLYDHLKDNGSPGLQKRPNSLFALTIPLTDNPLIPLDKSVLVFQSFLRNGLLADHGVRTLSPNDPGYKETHDESGENHDYSYHNGDVWPWLSGTAIEASLLVNRFDIGIQLLQNYVLRTVSVDTIGSIEEILDGTLPPSADPTLGTSRGAMSQAWSLAEFIRSVHQVWFGIRPSFALQNRTLSLTFNLPNFFHDSSIKTPLGEGKGTVFYQMIGKNRNVSLTFSDMLNSFDIVCSFKSRECTKIH